VIVVPPNKFTQHPKLEQMQATANYVTLIGIFLKGTNKYSAPFVNLAELSNIALITQTIKQMVCIQQQQIRKLAYMLKISK
jgi:hypothetical protein